MRNLFGMTIAGLGIFVLAHNASADSIIYYSSFTGPNGTQIGGLAPDINNGVPGATFGVPNTVWSETIQGNRARIGADTHASIQVSSGGGFVQPRFLRLSALLDLGTTAGPTTAPQNNPQRGIGLGYYESIVSVATNADFRGLVLGTDGRLILARAGEDGSPRAGIVEEIASGLDTSVEHTLSYDIDTLTGDIFNIVLDGVQQSDVDTTFFNSNVNRAGVFVSSSAGGRFGFADDFTVSAVPEPTSLLVGAIGLGALAVRRRRRG